MILHCKKQTEFKPHIKRTYTPFYKVYSYNFGERSLVEQVGYFYLHNEDCCYLLLGIVLDTLHVLFLILMINLQGRNNCSIAAMRKLGFRDIILASKRQSCYPKASTLFIVPFNLHKKKGNCPRVRVSSGLDNNSQQIQTSTGNLKVESHFL